MSPVRPGDANPVIDNLPGTFVSCVHSAEFSRRGVGEAGEASEASETSEMQ